MDLEKTKPTQLGATVFPQLIILPQGKSTIENPNENLLTNVQFLYDKFSYSKAELIGRLTLLLSYILTGLSVNTIQNNTINPETSIQLQDFILRNNEYLAVQVKKLLSMATKN